MSTIEEIYEEAKLLICGTSFPTKENRMDLYYTVFSELKKQGIGKESCRGKIKQLQGLAIPNENKIPRDKRAIIIKLVQQDLLRAFLGVYDSDIEVVNATEAETKVVETKAVTGEQRELEIVYAPLDIKSSKDVVLGPAFEERFDVEYAKLLGLDIGYVK